MRRFAAAIAIVTLLLFAVSCGGKKPPAALEPGVTEGDEMTVEQPDTSISEEDIEVVDEGVGIGEEGGISERPISEMTLEEINAAEFLRNIYFDFDMSDLRPDSIAQLDQNADWLKQHATVRAIIEGHCDERGTEEYNLALGERRAKGARDYLVRLGIAASRMMVVSYGESRPQELGSNESAWAMNRRAHFRVFER
ncbi:MAG TPA: peptidoglycan-associated lipoprotein Pal [Acidobacteriota bacterium]|nr:peptidoglycan-associated lipoprotein Pal [Acidobacteriota bacterium]